MIRSIIKKKFSLEDLHDEGEKLLLSDAIKLNNNFYIRDMKAKQHNFSIPVIFLNYSSDSICRVKISINKFQIFKKGDIIDVEYTCMRIMTEFVFNYFILKGDTNVPVNLLEDNSGNLNAEDFYDYMKYNINEDDKVKSIVGISFNDNNNEKNTDIYNDISQKRKFFNKEGA